MKVEKSAVYKLAVTSTCGCTASGEYADSLYKESLGDTAFRACETHAGKPGIEFIQSMLTEVVLKEAIDSKTPADPEPGAIPASKSLSPLTPAAEAAREARLSRAKGSAPAAQAEPEVRQAPAAASALSDKDKAAIANRTQGAEIRIPIAASRPKAGGLRRADQSAPKSGPVSRVDPKTLSRMSNSKQAAQVSQPAMLTLDIGEEVDEDPRLTSLLESSGVLDLDVDLDD